MGGGSGSGLLPGIGAPGAPGFLTPQVGQTERQAMGQSLTAMTNRYNQLGMPNSTPEMQDLGQAPSLTGGIPQEFEAVMGQLQTAALNNQGNAGGGKGGGKSGAGSALGALGGLKGA